LAEGWIKLHRCLLEKPIWACSTLEQKSMFITILLLANHAENEWEWNNKKYKCQPGQFITSLPSLAKTSGCSIQNVRTSLKRFKKYEFLTDEPTATGRLITVMNWEKYQAKQDALTGEPTDGQQTPNRHLTPNKNDKNDKNDKEIYIVPSKQIFDFWNLQKITVHKEITTDVQKAIIKALNKYDLDTILLAISRYSKVYNDASYYFNHKWTLIKFLTQSNCIPDFLDEGDKWINYLNRDKPKPQPKPPNETSSTAAVINGGYVDFYD